LALLLANKADINVAIKAQHFKIFKCFLLIDNELQSFSIRFFILAMILAYEKICHYSTWFTLVIFMQGRTLAHLASQRGRTETLALLLVNKADINAAMTVQQFKIKIFTTY
jgi:hypothetical protein